MMAKRVFSPIKVLASPPSILVSYFSSSSYFLFPPSPRKKVDENSRVAVWWDVESCPVPEDVNPATVSHSIKAALQSYGFNGPIQITAVGDLLRLSTSTSSIWKTLSLTDINIFHVPYRNCDRESDYLSENLLFWIRDNPPPAHLFLITQLYSEFSWLPCGSDTFNILLAYDKPPVELFEEASIVWRWNDLVKGDGKHYYLAPHPPYKSPFDKGAEEDVQCGLNELEDSVEFPNDKHNVEAGLLDKKVRSQVITGWLDPKANRSIEHVVAVVSEVDKYTSLVLLLKEVMDGSRIIIFTKTAGDCDQIASQLRLLCWPVLAIHEDKNQAERDEVLSEFKSGKSPVMTVTDLAARSLDVEDIKHLVNYDCPTSSEDYIHRIGCVADKGTLHTFFIGSDLANSSFARELSSKIGLI